MANYWTDKHDTAIKQYYQTTSIDERYQIISRDLSDALYEMASRALVNNGHRSNKEYEQDIVIHLVYKVLPKLSGDKLPGALQYLWTASGNYVKTYISNKVNSPYVDINTLTQCVCNKAIPDEVSDLNIYMSEAYVKGIYMDEPLASEHTSIDPVDPDADYELSLIRAKIINEIDLRIKGQTIINTTNSVFLLLLKQYILDNDYDVRGFGDYIQSTMRMKLNTYRAIAGRLGLRTKGFNEQLIGK